MIFGLFSAKMKAYLGSSSGLWSYRQEAFSDLRSQLNAFAEQAPTQIKL